MMSPGGNRRNIVRSGWRNVLLASSVSNETSLVGGSAWRMIFFEDSVLKLLGKAGCQCSVWSALMCIKVRNVVQGSGVPRLRPASTSLTTLLQAWKIGGKIGNRVPAHP